MKLYGIDQRLITAYNPQADGLVERKNKEVGRILKKHLKGTMDQWHTWLPITQLSLNLKILERMGSKPFKLFYGRLFNSFMNFTNIEEYLNIATVMERRMEKLVELRDVVWPAISKKMADLRRKRAKIVDNKLKQLPPLQPETKAMAIDQTRASKWDPIYKGPYTVIHQTEGKNYELEDVDGKMLNRRMTIHMLKPVNNMLLSGGRKLQQSKEKEKDEADQHYEVSGIMDHRLNRKKSGYQYLVRWKGFTAEEETWELEENFNDMAVIK